MLLPFPGSGCAHDLNAVQSGKPSSVRVRELDRSRLRRMAEEAAAKAVVLQQKQTEKDLNAASVLFRESARLFKAAGSNAQAAESLLQLGDTFFILSRYERAVSSYGQGAALVPENEELRCRALSRIARVYANSGQSALARKYSQEALANSEGVSEKTQAEVLQARGEAIQYSEPDAAVPLFLQARRLFADAGDDNGQAGALLMLSSIRYHSNHSQAVQLLAEALQLWSARDNHDGIALARRALGLFAAATDDFETARCNYQQALPMFQKIGDKDNEAIVLNVMGLASREMGDPETALAYYRRADLIFSNVHDLLGRGEAVSGLGATLRTLGQYRQLLQLCQLKLRLAQQTQNHAQIASTLGEMAAVYERQNQYAQSENYYRRSLSIYRSLGHDYDSRAGDALVGLAHLRALQGENAQAIAFLEEALPLKAKDGRIEDVARIYYELAYIYRRLSRLQEARTAIEKTIGLIESQRLSISKFDSRASYFASVHRYYALYIQVLMLLHRQDPQQGLMQLAFEASEKSKVRALLDLLNAASQESSCDDLLQRQLTPPVAGGAQVQEPTQPPDSGLSLHAIQAELEDDHTVLLEYALGDEKSYAWVVDRKEITFHELPAADRIRKLVEIIRETPAAREPLPGDKTADDIRNRERNADLAYWNSARELSALLLRPLALIPETRLLIVPDGSLQYVPFSALPLPEAHGKGAMLMNHHEIMILPSAWALGTLRKAAAKRPPPTSLTAIFADPVFEQDDPRVRLNRNPGQKVVPKRSFRRGANAGTMKGPEHFTRLEGSGAEARAIREILGKHNVAVIKGFNATRSYMLKGNLARYGVLHFATHGVIDLQHPEMSGLILSLINERGQKQDGHLRLGDIYGLRLSAGMVVLSACESALGKDLESEGTIGLPRAFLYAGAKCVIASLWKVDDDATAEFMKGFYARIKRGEGPSAALQGSQIEMSRKGKWSNPFYWAAFVAQGDCK